MMEAWTGLEPAHPDLKGPCVTPISPPRRMMVGTTGLEPATSCSQGKRSSQAELRPDGGYRTLLWGDQPESNGYLRSHNPPRSPFRHGLHKKTKAICLRPPPIGKEGIRIPDSSIQAAERAFTLRAKYRPLCRIGYPEPLSPDGSYPDVAIRNFSFPAPPFVACSLRYVL